MRDQGVGRARSRDRRDRGPRAGRRRPACSRRTSRRPRRCRSARRISPTAAPPRSCSTPATPTPRRVRRAGADARRMCELTGRRPRRRARRRARLLDRSHRHPDADGADRSGHPEAVRAGVERRRRRRGAGDPDHRHRAEGSRRDDRRGDRRRDGEGRGDALARDGDDARGRSRPMRPSTAPRLQRALAAAVAESFDCLSVDGCRSTNDTVLVLANGRAGAVDAARVHRRAHRGVRRRSPSRWRATPKARRSSSRVRVVGARTDADARIAARGVANSQLVQCSLNGGDPYWGRVLSELGASGALSIPSGRHRLQRCHRVPRRHRVRPRRGRARARRWPQPTSRSAATCTSAHGEATMLTTDLSHAYIDENRRTS